MSELYSTVDNGMVPFGPEASQFVAPSRPLYELAEISRGYRYGSGSRLLRKAPWPIAIDTTAQAYAEALHRRESDEFQAAPNRVAIIFGEGYLHTAINYMPEDTIIMADIEDGANDYMEQYGTALEEFDFVDGWLAAMGKIAPLQTSRKSAESYFDSVRLSALDWEQSGYSSAILNPALYQQSHEVAKTKALIPWKMDLANPDDFIKLARHLRDADATVTFMNATNIMGLLKITKIEQTIADNISVLPHIPTMRIIGSSWLIHRAFRKHTPGGDAERALTNRVIIGPDHLRRIGEVGYVRTGPSLAERFGIPAPVLPVE